MFGFHDLVCRVAIIRCVGFVFVRSISEATATTRARTKADPYGMTNRKATAKGNCNCNCNCNCKGNGKGVPGFVRFWCSFEVYFGWSAGWGGGESEGEL
jgi:hypothetical protein